MIIATAVFLAAAQATVIALEIYPFSSGLEEFGVQIMGFYLVAALFVAALVCMLVSWVKRHELGSRRWLHLMTMLALLLPLLNLVYFTLLPTAERLGKAARLGDRDVVARCLFWGIDPDATYVAAAGFGGRGRTRPPLELAAVGGHVGVMTLLLDAGASINANDSAALARAVGNGQTRAVEVLLDRDAQLARAMDVTTRPSFGTGSGQIEALQVLLQRRPDALGGPGLLLMAAYHGAPSAAREIAAVDVAGRYGPVYELLRQLALERPTEAAYRDAAASLTTPDSERARLQALEYFQYRSDHRDLEFTQLTGEVILNLAVKFGNRTLTAALLADGVPAEPPLDDRLQLLTPLHRAIYEDRLDLAQMLIAAGADLDRPNRTFGRPLHLAVQSGSMAMLELLIDAGAPLEAPETQAGSGTALFVAVHHDDLERTRVLIQAGADPHAAGWRIGTACDLARGKDAVSSYMATVCEGSL